VLRFDRSAQGKNGQKVRGQAPYVDPAPEKVGVPLDPVALWPVLDVRSVAGVSMSET